VAATPSLLVKYSVPSRSPDPKVVSNRYHFNGGVPATDAAWHTLMDAVVAAFADCLYHESTIIGVNGYTAGSDIAIASKTYSTIGTRNLATDSAIKLPGFCCAIVRWATDQRTSKNHPIYLYSYIHGVACSNADARSIKDAQVTAITTFANRWRDTGSGFSDGTNTYHRAGPNGAAGLAVSVSSDTKDHDLSPR
jgi:hypothetical protein